MSAQGYRSYFGFWFGGLASPTSTPTPVTPHGGHYGAADYKKYRKYLERIAKLQEQRIQEKYIKEVAKLSEVAEEIEVKAPEIQKAAYAVEAKEPIVNIDFEKIAREIKRIEAVIEHYIDEQEEEEIILMMLQ